MDLSDAIRLKIYNLLQEHNVNIWYVCKESGIPCSTITTFLNGKTKMIRIDNILHICEAFNITLSEFFGDEVFNNVKSD